MQEFYSLGHWLGECFIKVNESGLRPFHWPCPSLSACYPVTMQMCKSPSLSFSSSASLFSPPNTLRSANRTEECPIKCLRSCVLGSFCVSSVTYMTAACPALNTSDFTFTHTYAKLLWLTPVTSFCQTRHEKVAIQFASVWEDEIKKRSKRAKIVHTGCKNYPIYVKVKCAFSLLIWVYKLSKFFFFCLCVVLVRGGR